MSAFDIEAYYDGGCPLCVRGVRLLRRLDTRGRIRFVVISAPGFDAASIGVRPETLMDRIHGRLPDGTMIEGVEVFRRLYAAHFPGQEPRSELLAAFDGLLARVRAEE